MSRLYIGLENTWIPPPGLSLKENEDYVRLGLTTFIKSHVKPHIELGLTFVRHLRFPVSTSLEAILEKYPELENWVGTDRPVGRYEYQRQPDEIYVIDLIFDGFGLGREYTEGMFGYWRNWTYDLKTAEVADVVMALLAELSPEKRLPSRVARHLASRTNEKNTDHGIVYGSWDPQEIRTGLSPSNWKSSYHVFRRYLANGRQPIRYGQCWVFAEVLTTMYRYLGLPARTIRIDGARIDHGRDGGIDYGLTVTKGNAAPAITPMAPDLKDFETLGEVYRAETVSKGDIQYNVHDLVSPDDGEWNFHLVTEVFLPQTQWNCVDVSPCLPSDSSDEYAHQYLFGPCPVEAIRMCLPTPHDFDFLNSTFNSLYRYWTTVENVTFPYRITYGTLQGSRLHVTTRDIHDSVGVAKVVLEDITSSYVHSREKAYAYYHRNYPILFAWGTPDELTEDQKRQQVETRDLLGAPVPKPKAITPSREYRAIIRQEGEFFLQTAFFRSSGRLLVAYRERLQTSSLQPYPVPEEAENVSFVIVDPISKRWWAQVI